MFPALGTMSSDMPNFNAPDDQAQALAFYISHEASKPMPHKTRSGGMPTGSNHSATCAARSQATAGVR